MLYQLSLCPAHGRASEVTDCGVRVLWLIFLSSILFLVSTTETSSLSRVVRAGGDPCSVPWSGWKKDTRWSLRLGRWTATTVQKTTLKLRLDNPVTMKNNEWFTDARQFLMMMPTYYFSRSPEIFVDLQIFKFFCVCKSTKVQMQLSFNFVLRFKEHKRCWSDNLIWLIIFMVLRPMHKHELLYSCFVCWKKLTKEYVATLFYPLVLPRDYKAVT